MAQRRASRRWRRGTPALVALLLAALGLKRVDACCPNNCNGHGECSDDRRCRCNCHLGFTGGDCSLYVCPSGAAWNDMATGTDQAHAIAECSNVGHCDRTSGECICAADGFLAGFTGPACDRRFCPGDGCSGHGKCMSMRDYAKTKETGYQADPFASPPVYDTPWDAEKIYGCLCDPGYHGEDCLSRECPTGDDPLTLHDGKGQQVDEVHTFACNATEGTFYLKFRGHSTLAVAATATARELESAFNALDTVDGAKVTLTGYEQTTVCGADRWVTELVNETTAPPGVNVTYINMTHGFDITFEQQFGDLPLTLAYGGNLKKAYDADGPDGPDEPVKLAAQLTAVEKVKGNKENDDCSNRGICDATTGMCACGLNFDTSNGRGQRGDINSNRGDCGNAIASITACPGEIKCSAHGICQQDIEVVNGTSYAPSYRCHCSTGWTGFDCSLRFCPEGPAWFGYPSKDNVAHEQKECSGMGLCDRSKGECSCQIGFTGGACERMGCANLCSGHGQCLTMQLLAEKHRDRHGAPAPTVYGTANNPYSWDYQSMQGCYCDEGWMGYDCMLVACPSGSDPLVRDVNDEVQLLRCNFTDGGQGVVAEGSFTLSFRGIETANIAHGATEAQVKAALEALSTVGRVDVAFTKKATAVGQAALLAADQACTLDNSNWIQVSFRTELGDLPDLGFKGVGGVRPVADTMFDGMGDSLRGNKENIMCSNRGTCDHNTGLCTCFHGFGSSDGNGGQGTRGDCGHYLAYAGAADNF